MITLKLTIEEANVIMSSLAKQPYEQVYELIAKVHEQGNSQIQSKNKDDDVEAKSN